MINRSMPQEVNNIQQGKTFFVKIVFGELDKYMIKNKNGTFAHII